MIPQYVKQKFSKRGRQAAFARFAGVTEATVSLWIDGRTVSARLDRLAREWDPTAEVVAPACDRPGCPGV